MIQIRLSTIVAFALPMLLAVGGALLAPPEPARAETAGVIFVVDQDCCGGNGGVIRIDPSLPAGSDQTIVSSGQFLVDPSGVALAPDGTLYVADFACCGGNGGVIKVDPRQPNGSNQTVVSSGQDFVDPSGIVIAADGTLYVSDVSCCIGGGGNGAVIRVDPRQPNGSNQTIISSGMTLRDPTGIAQAADGRLYLADNSCCGSGGVIRIDPSLPNGSNQTVVSSGDNFDSPAGIAVAPDGRLYVVDLFCCASGTSTGAVIRVDPNLPNGSNQVIVSQGQGFLNPFSVAFNAAGNLYVGDAACCVSGGLNGGLIEVDLSLPNGSNQFLISSAQNFAEPLGLAVVPQVSIADAAAVTEGTSADVPVTFTVTRTPWSVLPLTVPFTITGSANGAATSLADFSSTSGTVTFPAGQTTATATVQVVGDALAEPTETFTVALNPPNGVATIRVATGTIQDNDGTATLSIGADLTQAEGQSRATTFTFPVTLSPASGPVVTVQYTAVAGTAQAGQDFQATTGTLTFQSGETTKTIEIPVVADAVIEPDEAFAVTLSAPTGSAAIGRATATATIANDDSACTPRPSVVPTPVAGTGKLSVHVASTPLNTQAANPLTEIRFGAFQNGRVVLNGQTIAGGQTVTLPPNTTAIDFTVERITAGQATTVPFSVVDGCGEWQTFVGGGAGAF